ncbi:hypothetical protein H310_13660 [Aphanomyces invadans]|nr:hypothetical protein H310_13660 [Aphanomyces invadans]ETV91831.1 hypothetical protein H310_13660 [Aphanomyces invadans]|eukprot:XP_008879468.1 hypothetical protein H310_13660 [Aphanomyces invadans]
MPEASNQDEVDGPRGVMSKSDLMAFLRDPTVTASSIRTHVATGRIDAIAVLAISHRELVDAKVPPLAVRMLFISAMAATQPTQHTPSKAPPSILPPPGFSALSIATTDTHPLKHDSHVRATSPQRSPVIPSKPGAATALFPRAGHHRPDQHVPDNQYEREMERISNQMTRNVLD